MIDWHNIEVTNPPKSGKYLVVQIRDGAQRVKRWRWSTTGWAADKEGNQPLIIYWAFMPTAVDDEDS